MAGNNEATTANAMESAGIALGNALGEKAPEYVDAWLAVMNGMAGRDVFFAIQPGTGPLGIPSVVIATGEAAKPAADNWNAE